MFPQCPEGTMRRTGLGFGFLLLAILGFSSLWFGSRPISPAVIWQALIHFDPQDSEHLLIRHLRLPRTLLAMVTGAALGGAGVIMQTLTRNPLADPGLLGVNAGATLAIVLAIAFCNITSVGSYMWFGVAGAGVISILVFIIGGLNGDNPIRIVLAGAALTIVLLSLTQLVILNSDSDAFDRFRHWVTGSLQGRGFDVLMPVSMLISIGMALALAGGRMLDVAALGPDAGRALGINPHVLTGFSALIIVILAGAATAAAGPIGFVGLTAPHFARAIVGSGHRLLLPWAMIFSAVLVLTADILGRIIGHPGEISVGIMAALIGGPFFVLLVKRWQGERV
ncbi:Fe(3+)-siderophore ABC transporter permease [Citrobacter amalonaticus]|uniref:Fe(3+)-siderophore ABC transporter permease n=1 Tax=Citrobacter amalonaticus TaxID=35703 RepID=A0A2S4S097_CITAM|nr:iron ABC transporter permease [Citrobacter amalonaticus]POT58305.1 Fe(3+)-siderophore ABC transporter permease [Citrobacter amalonaticus]POT76170.1 Fe(3+)-siderophore ABC transporter permease [Citrobacter amalonaticus]POU66832.1 Fe(3+)-siderophore ABC transporter permease [Citrobacter amalonaticus]POV05405.1 Fe(3+)-siderophore ABC transporter permease [Citrobacter amalonaticus]